jgi:DNA-binding NarL/FixJ family response regulator
MLDFTTIPDPSVLTSTERQILSLFRQGYRDGDTARELYLSVQSVRDRRGEILQKLGLCDLLELAFYAGHYKL